MLDILCCIFASFYFQFVLSSVILSPPLDSVNRVSYRPESQTIFYLSFPYFAANFSTAYVCSISSLTNCFSSALEKWLQPGFNLPCKGAGGVGGAGHCKVFSGLHWLCSQSSGFGFKCFLGGAAATYFSNLNKRKDGKLSVLQKCVNPHSRAVILLNKVKLSSVIPFAQNMAYGLCSQMINSNKEKNAFC